MFGSAASNGFNAAGELTLVASDVGPHKITMGVTRKSSKSTRASYLNPEQPMIVEILHQPGVQTFEVSFDPADYERLLAEFTDTRR